MCSADADDYFDQTICAQMTSSSGAAASDGRIAEIIQRG